MLKRSLDASIMPPKMFERGLSDKTLVVRSYRDHVRQLCLAFPKSWEFRRLDRFFSDRSASCGRKTQVTIVDCIDTAHVVQGPVTGASDLERALGNVKASVESRVILVEYEERDSLDREIIELLGSCYNLDEYLLLGHLEQEYELKFGLRPSFRFEQGIVELIHFGDDVPEGNPSYYCSAMLCKKAEASYIEGAVSSVGTYR